MTELHRRYAEFPVLVVLDDLADVVGHIGSEQLTLPTPCGEFDVAALQRHLLGWLELFRVALSDPAGQDRPEPAAYVGPAEPKLVAGVIEQVADAVCAALEDDVERRTVNVPALGGTLPGGLVVSMLTAEALGHGWDLAKATGQSWRPDPAICEQTLAALQPVVLPEYRGAGMPFGPAIEIVADAPPLDRFVAFTGRPPGWTANVH